MEVIAVCDPSFHHYMLFISPLPPSPTPNPLQLLSLSFLNFCFCLFFYRDGVFFVCFCISFFHLFTLFHSSSSVCSLLFISSLSIFMPSSSSSSSSSSSCEEDQHSRVLYSQYTLNIQQEGEDQSTECTQ